MPEPSRGSVLSVPAVNPITYSRNFIRQAVCELRFPTLLALEQGEPPIDFQKVLRRAYPHFERKAQLVIEGTEAKPRYRYLFKSRDQHWFASLTSSTISLETTQYTEFSELHRRLRTLVDDVKELLDTSFFTRIGLRYINVLPTKDRDVKGWVNDDLVRPLTQGTYGDPVTFWQEVRGSCEKGFYSFRHGLMPDDSEARPYVLDFDLYQENVEFGDLDKVLDELHTNGFAIFSWTLGPQALDWLNKPAPKERKP
jgi:uncharacterized protein (TIGR04255 family)